MSAQLDNQLQTALNETRLLILGVQVLFGFQFEAFFQDAFSDLGRGSKTVSLAALALLVVAVGLLIAPTMRHRLTEGGHSSVRLLQAVSIFASIALALVSLALGLMAFPVASHHFGIVVGLSCAVLLTAISVFFWFGLEAMIGLWTGKPPPESGTTPLGARVQQLLTEARLIIPGAQALFGFQFVVMLTTGFDNLPFAVKVVHSAGLVMVALDMILLMTPAALHRLSYGGQDSETFVAIGSAFLVAALLFLAGAIAAEIYVVFFKVLDSESAAALAAGAAFVLLIALWYAYPLALRAAQPCPRHRAHKAADR